MDKKTLRELFPVVENVIYLNHAAVGPLSTRAYAAMERHARDQRDFGALHWREWYEAHAALRRVAAQLLGARPEEIAILKNTSEGLSFVAEGYRWEAGDNVITTDLEFPSNSTPWRRLARRGVECRTVISRDGAYGVEDVERLIDSRTRILSVSSVAFHNGFTADLDALGELCARRNVLFCVDAIQSVGALPIDVRRSKISFLAADGHKWMCGPEGTALFYVAEEHRASLEVLESGWTNFERRGKFIDCGLELLPDARRFEAGSANTNGLYGLRAAIELLLELGVDAIAREVIRLGNYLADGLESIGYRLATPRPIRSPIISAVPPPVESAASRQLYELHQMLERNGVVCAPREGLLRFAPHVYNEIGELDRVLALLQSAEIAVVSR